MKKLVALLIALRDAVDLRDAFAFAGLGFACYGISQVYPPAAWVVGGVALFWLGVKES